MSLDSVLARERANIEVPQIKADDSKGSLAHLLDQAMTSSSAGDLEIIDYLNGNFGTIESLENVDSIIGELDTQITEIDVELKDVIRDQAYAAETARMQLDTINERSTHLVQRIGNVKQTAASSESMVKTGCTEIRKLDTAKKNLTFSITALKRLIMLLEGIEQFSYACMEKRYKEAAHLIEATDELLLYFKDYMQNTQQIAEIKKERDRLCKELRLQILEDFSRIGKGSQKEQLYEACFALDAIGEQAVNDLRVQFCRQFLSSYEEPFAPGKPDSSLENTKRRFAWFKRILKEATSGPSATFNIFPDEWQMPQLLAQEFCRITKVHLDEVLSQSASSADLRLVIESMQQTIEFESDLHRRYPPIEEEESKALSGGSQVRSQINTVDGKVEVAASGNADDIRAKYGAKRQDSVVSTEQTNQDAFDRVQAQTKLENRSKIAKRTYKFEGQISQCFEPYLQTYSEQEQTKLQITLDQVCAEGVDSIEKIDFEVFSSSLHLFKGIKESLDRCLKFSRGSALFNLQCAFKSVFKYYTRTLKFKLPAKTFEDSQAGSPFLLSDEQELRCVYMINTCEYCLEVIPQLHDQIEDRITEEFENNVDLKDEAEDMFRELINSAIRVLVSSIEARTDQLYATKLLKQNWLQFESVEDTSEYIKVVCQAIQARSFAIKTGLNPIYQNLFLNKVVGATSDQFLKQLFRIKKISDASAHQFQLDLEELKNTLLSLPCLQQVGQQPSGKPSDTYLNYVSKSITRVERRIKVLSYPTEIIEDTYINLIEDHERSQAELTRILEMRGAKAPQNNIMEHAVVKNIKEGVVDFFRNN